MGTNFPTESAPPDVTLSEEIFGGSSSLRSKLPVSEGILGGSSLSLPAETLGDSSQNGLSPYLGNEGQDDRSLVLSSSSPIGSSANLPPNETLGAFSSMPEQTGHLDEYPNFLVCKDEETLQAELFPSCSGGLMVNNLLDSSSSHWSSPDVSSSWPSYWSSWSSSEEFKPSTLSFSSSDFKPPMVGAGLANLGNTCFLNAVLQCLTHTVPLVQALRSCNHASSCACGSEEFCVLCSLLEHVERSLAASGAVLSPLKLVENLNHISASFQRYQQEDAHEFMQCFLDKLEGCLDLKMKDNNLLAQDDNLVERVFGGRLVSKLRCCNCGHSSDTYEPLIDLSLEIEDVDTLPSALMSFTKVEKIEDSETKFTCENCKGEVLMEKQFMLDQAPSVAAFHLKRFKADGLFVEKVGKHVEFPLELDLHPYTSGSQDDTVELKYDLYAVIVHIGFSSTSGHYFCFIRSSPGTWYRLDDSKVTSVSEEFVLSQEAYILFYAKQGTPCISSLMEEQRSSLNPSILNTSPKSVLDNVDGVHASYPGAAVVNYDADESRNAAEGNSCEFSDGLRQKCNEFDEVRDAAAGSSGHLLYRSQDELRSNDPRDDTPVDYTSAPLGPGTYCDDEILCSTSSLGRDNCQKGVDEVKDDGFHPLTPPGSPSQDKVSLTSPGVKYHIPRDHLKTEKQVSCKKQLNKALEDSKKKEAVRYLSRNGPQSRRADLLAAVLGSHSEGSLNKRKRMGSSPCQKTNSSSGRRKANNNSIVHPVAAGVFR